MQNNAPFTEWTNANFRISTKKEELDLPYIHAMLGRTYWAEGIPFDVVQRSVAGSLCFGIYTGKKQVGFARIITDEATFAYLCDVFVDESYRGQGLGKWLVDVILSYAQLQGLRRFLLATKDAHELYRQYGFSELPSPERWMQIHNADVYKTKARD